MGRWIDKIKNSSQRDPGGTDIADVGFDPDQAQELFANVLTRLNEQCSFGAISWVRQHRPEIWHNCQAALAKVEIGFNQQDMAAVQEAIKEFEAANLALFKEYPGLPWRPGQKGTGAKVWQLTDTQAAELGALFATPGVVDRRGARWYSPDAWEGGPARGGTTSLPDQ